MVILILTLQLLILTNVNHFTTMKKYFTIALFLLISVAVVGQEEEEVEEELKWYQEYQGWSYEAMAGLFLPTNPNFPFYSFGVHPRYNIIAPKDYLSISAGMPFNFGVNLVSGFNGTLVQLMAGTPLTMDLNIGARATPFNEHLFGGYVGFGLDYNFMHFSVNSGSQTVHTLGPIIHGGFRWEYRGRPTGFRISYTNGFDGSDKIENGIIIEGDKGSNIFTFSILYGVN